MSNLLILDPIDLDPGWITASSAAAGFPASQLANPDPLVIWQSAAGGSLTLDIDLQADTAVDTVYLGYTLPVSDATWEIRGATAAQTTGYLTDPGAVMMAVDDLVLTEAITPYHAFWTGTERTIRYLRINITNTGTAFEAGVVLAGKAWRPTWNHEWESGRSLTDLSIKERMPSGNLTVDTRGIVGDWRWTLGDLDDAEVRQLWAILKRHGASRPLLVVEDPDDTAGLNERLHYGVMSDLQRFSRTETQKTKWEFTFEDWL